MNKRCSECDGVLWSDMSKQAGAHPECVGEDPPIDLLDVEDQIDNFFKALDKPHNTL